MNQRPFSIFTIILFSGMLVSASQLLPNAFAHGGVDESFTGPVFSTGADFSAVSQVAGQTFTPDENNIIAVDLFLFEQFSPPSASVTVTIRNGGVLGTDLGSKSMLVNLIPGTTTFQNPAVVHFDFDSPIPLVPGQTYGIQFESTSINIRASASGGNPYLEGAAFQGSNPIAGFDWGFATYFSPTFVPVDPIETFSGGGISRHTPPSFGQNSDLSHWLLRDAFCVDIKNCWDIPGNHGVPFDLFTMGASVHTFSIKVYCPRGPQDCTHVGLSVEPYGTDINSAIWTVAMHKDFGTTGDFQLIVNDPPTDEYTEGYLGEVTGTSQIIEGEGNAYLFVSFTMDMLVPTPGGMMFGLHAWDSSGGTTNSYQNDGIEIVDTFAYPTMDPEFEEPLDIPKVCLYEDPDYRHSCAFALKKQLEMEKAEKIREEIMLHNTWYRYID